MDGLSRGMVAAVRQRSSHTKQSRDKCHLVSRHSSGIVGVEMPCYSYCLLAEFVARPALMIPGTPEGRKK
jgi:hypothetical protein